MQTTHLRIPIPLKVFPVSQVHCQILRLSVEPQIFLQYFFQGDADGVIPVNIGTYLYCPNYNELFGSLCLYRRLTANGQLAVAHILHGSGHENSDTSGYPDSFTADQHGMFYHKLINHQGQTSKIYYDMEYSCQ